MEAVRQNGHALQHASAELGGDHGVVLGTAEWPSLGACFCKLRGDTLLQAEAVSEKKKNHVAELIRSALHSIEGATADEQPIAGQQLGSYWSPSPGSCW